MSALPEKANVVIVGAGIVGNSIVYHLAKEGWTDIVQVDKGLLPNPGGSTGHASNFIFPVDHSKGITEITLDSMNQYKELGVFTESGGIELARTSERMEELKRRMDSAKSWGIEDARLITPAEVQELVPYVDTDVILGGFWSPGVGVVDSVQAGTLMRESAQAMGVLSVSPDTQVTGVKVENGSVRGLQTNQGDIQTSTVVIACGVWSPRIARMAGAFIPLSPVVHQMISVGPIEVFEETEGEISYPIVRDMDALMYERQHGNELEIGSYAHRAILHDPDEIPPLGKSRLSPTEMPFTQEDFDPQMEQALELMPEILDREDVGIRYSINGLLSLTPDAAPALGETPEVEGLWSAASVWVKEGPGVGRVMADWITHGIPETELHEVNIARFYDYARTKSYVNARVREGFIKTYGIVHPEEQWSSARNLRLSPFYERERELGAVFHAAAGWERPHWYESNAPLVEEYRDRIFDRSNEWDSRWWSPIIQAEHLAMRDRAAMIDLTAFAVFDVTGPGALAYVQHMAVAQVDVPVGKAVYTPILDTNGGFRSDLTIIRRGESEFRIVTGGASGGMDQKWFRDHLPEDGSVQLHDQTSALCTLGIWGPRARDLLQAVTENDLSHKGFPFAAGREITIGEVRAWALRISYVGELGWEVYAPMEQGKKLWDILRESGQEQNAIPAGIGVYGTTGRLEKGYRLYGHELELEYDPIEAGLTRPEVKQQDFIGREAYLRALEEEPAAMMCTLTVDDHKSSTGEARYMLGHEPVLTPAGEAIVDSKGRHSYVTSAGDGPSSGKYILMSYLPPEYAEAGTSLAVEYFGERYPVTVAIAGSTPLFDPDNQRMKR